MCHNDSFIITQNIDGLIRKCGFNPSIYCEAHLRNDEKIYNNIVQTGNDIPDSKVSNINTHLKNTL